MLFSGFMVLLAAIGVRMIVQSRRRATAMEEVFASRRARPLGREAVRAWVRRINDESTKIWFHVESAVYRAYAGRWLVLFEGEAFGSYGRGSQAYKGLFVVAQRTEDHFFEQHRAVFRRCFEGAEGAVYGVSVFDLHADDTPVPLAARMPELPRWMRDDSPAEVEGELADATTPRAGPAAVRTINPQVPRCVILDTSDGQFAEVLLGRLASVHIAFDVETLSREELDCWVLSVAVADQAAALDLVEAAVAEEEIVQARKSGLSRCPQCGAERVVCAAVEGTIGQTCSSRLCRVCGFEWV